MNVAVRCLGVFLLVAHALSAAAQEWAKARLEQSPRHLEWVTVPQGDRAVKSFLAFPEVKEKATAVVVIHEIFGLTDWVRSVTDQLAEAGYIAIAPDLLSGMGPDGGGTSELGGGDAVRKAISSLAPDQITADLKAVVAYVGKLPAANGKVAVAGFCWGGSQTFRLATNHDGIKAAFPFYGSGPTVAAEIARIRCPVYGFYGGNDARVNANIPTSKELMQQAGKRYEPVTYDGAGHGFMRAGEGPDASEPNRRARTEAWRRWTTLLRDL
ncbi:MAG: dienelactone hydrolase family protein [Verrucomicrobia bacterium]|nr:dienelactone hydrolase family protein [Verrucomicrobiota bacterium]